MPRVNREKLLQLLESLEPGRAGRETIQQSTCFVFSQGACATFDGEMACWGPTGPMGLGSLTGAVRGDILLGQLRLWPEDEIDINPDGDKLVIQGNGQRAKVAMEAQVLLPVDKVECAQPTDWHKLPDDFADAAALVSKCAGDDEKQFPLPCCHLTPKGLEARDAVQVARWETSLPVPEGVLVRATQVKHAGNLGVTEMALTGNWLHFRNPGGLRLSMRRFLQDYVDVDKYLNLPDGHELQLPPGLKDAAERAALAVSVDGKDAKITVDLRPGGILVTGQSVAGHFAKPYKATYDGPPFRFVISPDLLTSIVEQHQSVQIVINGFASRLKVDGGRYTYVAALGTPEGQG
jgi:hypothetical protein